MNKFNTGDKVIVFNNAPTLHGVIGEIIEHLTNGYEYDVWDKDNDIRLRVNEVDLLPITDDEIHLESNIQATRHPKFNIRDKVRITRNFSFTNVNKPKEEECWKAFEKFTIVFVVGDRYILDGSVNLWDEELLELIEETPKECGTSKDCYGEYETLLEKYADLEELYEGAKLAIKILSDMLPSKYEEE